MKNTRSSTKLHIIPCIHGMSLQFKILSKQDCGFVFGGNRRSWQNSYQPWEFYWTRK